MSEETIRTILGAFLFTGDDADKKVKVLSGGEKSRLILAKLLINPPNCLLLDEPTTHLDVDAVEALVEALREYQGTAVFISHDIYFVRSIANTVYEVKNGRIRKFPESFDYYLEKRETLQEITEQKKQAPDPLKLRAQEERARAKEEERKSKEETRKRKAHNAIINEKVTCLTKEKEKLNLESYAKARALSNPRIYRDEETARDYGRRLKEIGKLISGIDSDIKKLQDEII